MQTGETVRLPERRLISGAVSGNRVVQVANPEMSVRVGASLSDGARGVVGFSISIEGVNAALLLDKPYALDGYNLVLGAVADKGQPPWAPSLAWMGSLSKPSKPGSLTELEATITAVRNSWEGSVVLVEETRNEDGTRKTSGLRPPQVGGVFGVLSHWKGHDGIATVVMPTGTGKTETMLTLLVHQRFKRLLVLVPSDTLRDQIGRKFETLGRLRELGVLGATALNPVVGRLSRKPKTADEAREFFMRCNVVVSTVQALTGLPNAVQNAITECFDTLFIDEAHHVAARTWSEVRELFVTGKGHRVVQFTATPFREDGKLVDGKVVFRFPMRRAMDQGYFTKIRFLPIDVDDENRVDLEIATETVRQLRGDLEAGFDHVVMARTKNIKRAANIREIYQCLAPEFVPMCVHSKLPKGGIAVAKAALLTRTTRIIVCVDMLGEGFDFPNMKIAALHDPHRSLAVTLQFVGRFTRDDITAGQATAVACLADPRMDDRIQSLYSEDADWNVLLDNLSEGQTGAAAARSDFLDGFGISDDDLVSLKQIFPKMSTSIFRTTTANWRPHRMEDGLGTHRTVRMGPRVNPAYRCVLVITEESEPVPWGSTKLVTNTMWNLFLAYWDEERNLIFINTSDKSTALKPLAEALAGGEVHAVNSEDVYKTFHGIQRMTLLNVGLKSRANRFTRFRMLVGPDVTEGMSPASLAGSSKTNVFVTGREHGQKVTLGASAKGRIWSYSVAHDMGRWVKWCQELGKKVRDPSIKRETVLEGALTPTLIEKRPEAMPLSVEWSADILAKSEDAVLIDFGSGDIPILDVSMEMVPTQPTEPIRFTVACNGEAVTFEIEFRRKEEGARFIQLGGRAVSIMSGKARSLLADWFNENPPCILFADLSELEGNLLFSTRHPTLRPPLPPEQLLDWVWLPPTDITKESFRKHGGTGLVPVQEHVFREIQTATWATASGFTYEVVFDDDGSGEAADIVAIGSTATEIHIDLLHCKFSGGTVPGARVGDLYEVCGQSARSVRWINNATKLLAHLVKREKDAVTTATGSRFILGDRRALRRLERAVADQRVIFRVFAVQPGLSKGQVSSAVNVAEILASVDTYLRQCAELGFQVICSA